MIDAYSAHMIARTEHELMKASVARYPNRAAWSSRDRFGWLARSVGRLYSAVDSGLSALTAGVKQGQGNALDVSLRDHETDSIAG